MLSSSYPSGKPNIVSLREQLSAHCLISCPTVHRPAIPPVAVDLATLVVPVNTGFASGYVYVGSGCLDHNINPSPRGSPFGCSSLEADEQQFLDYAYARADACTWLSPPVGKILVCQCVASKNNHVQIISQLSMKDYVEASLPDYNVPASWHVNETLFVSSVVFQSSFCLKNISVLSR